MLDVTGLLAYARQQCVAAARAFNITAGAGVTVKGDFPSFTVAAHHEPTTGTHQRDRRPCFTVEGADSGYTVTPGKVVESFVTGAHSIIPIIGTANVFRAPRPVIPFMHEGGLIGFQRTFTVTLTPYTYPDDGGSVAFTWKDEIIRIVGVPVGALNPNTVIEVATYESGLLGDCFVSAGPSEGFVFLPFAVVSNTGRVTYSNTGSTGNEASATDADHPPGVFINPIAAAAGELASGVTAVLV